MIDHIAVQSECVNYISNCCILDDDCLNVSSDRPIIMTWKCSVESLTTASSLHRPVKWDTLQPIELQPYVDEMNT